MDTMSKERAQEVITATRQALTNSIKELGTPIEVGMLNFDKHRLTEKDLQNFNREIDQITLRALERNFIIR